MGDLVSIVIVNYNTEKLLSDCLKSIYEYTRNVSFEIIVVDNNSEEGSLDTLISSYPQVYFQLLGNNLGFGAANNIGVSVAKGNYVFFLNPDTILVSDAVSILYKYLMQHTGTGVCGGNLYKKDMSPAESFQGKSFRSRYNWEILMLFNKKWETGFNYSDDNCEVRAIMGADFFMRKDLFLEVKGFDTDFFMYFEEVELCDRVKNAGYKIVSVPAAKIIHLEGGSAENKNDELKKWSYREHWYSKFIYFSKVEGLFKTSVIYRAHMFKISLASLLYSLKGKRDKQEYWNAKKQVITGAYNRYKNFLGTKK